METNAIEPASGKRELAVEGSFFNALTRSAIILSGSGSLAGGQDRVDAGFAAHGVSNQGGVSFQFCQICTMAAGWICRAKLAHRHWGSWRQSVPQ